MKRELLPSTRSPGSNNTHPLHGSGDEDAARGRRDCSYPAPPPGHDLRSPWSGQASERPPGWALGGPPVRVLLPLTSLGGEDRASPCAAIAALRPDARRKSGPRGRVAEAAARTDERAGSRPSLSAPREAVSGGRCLPPSAPLPLSFLQPTPLPLRAAGKPVTVVVSTLSRATPSSQRRRRHSLGRPIYVRLSLPVGLGSGSRFTAG